MDVTLLDAGMHDNIGLTLVEHHDKSRRWYPFDINAVLNAIDQSDPIDE